MSEECIKSELDLFTVPLTQTAIEKNTYVEIPPLSAISDTGPLEFFIAGHGEDYTDLNNTLLYLRLKITKPDGSDIDDGAAVGLINYPGATLFSQVDVSIGDRLISQSSSTYPYRSIIECLANYGRDTLETVFSAGLFYLDTAGAIWHPVTSTLRCCEGRTTEASIWYHSLSFQQLWQQTHYKPFHKNNVSRDWDLLLTELFRVLKLNFVDYALTDQERFLNLTLVSLQSVFQEWCRHYPYYPSHC
ncbi:hypothetical protein NFI96_006326 [Prochilodus magdalenae]|nr:hypothetical protein NFI96_006326 [Prochilodus magdalenae]